MAKYKVWDCKIVIPIEAKVPDGFDAPPRTAAINAVVGAGINVCACFSGWAGTLTQTELKIVSEQESPDYPAEAEPCTPTP